MGQFKRLLVIFVFLFLVSFANAQKLISGRITGPDNAPLPSVSILVKGTTNGASTNEKGEYSIKASEKSVLVITSVGYATVEVRVGSKQKIDVAMQATDNSLNDVVVVGYTTQKKRDLTGSIATVSGANLVERPATNAATLLQGKLPGLAIVQPSGQPGADQPSLVIRGKSSYGTSSAPLILIDGVQGDINAISPQDIESVTLLKDAASAAIYGSRAANGVLLITSKRGHSGGFRVDYASNYGYDEATKLPKLVYNSAQYMQMFNSAREHSGYSDVYTQAQIDAYAHPSPDSLKYYPNYNWIDNYFGKAARQSQHLSFHGGDEKTAYNFSLSDINQASIVRGHSYDRLNLLFNIDSKISKVFKMGVDVAFNYQNVVQPWANGPSLILIIYHAQPTYMPYLPDGSGRIANGDYPASFPGQRSPEYVIRYGGITTKTYEARSQGYIQANILKGLTWMVKGAFDYTDQFQKILNPAVNEYLYQKAPGASDYSANDNGYPGYPGITDYDVRNIFITAYSTINYTHSFGDRHHLDALIGFEQNYNNNQDLRANRASFPSNTITQLDGGSTNGQSLNGNSFEWALRSYFGNVRYNYADKYLLSGSFRYDGSSRLSPSGRWGLFPAISAGWVVSKENFMKSTSSWLSSFKIRVSDGTLGNQNILKPNGDPNYYPYQSLYAVGAYSYGNSANQGAYLGGLVDPSIKWEKTNVINFATDIDIKNGLLTATIEKFRRRTTGILATQAVPTSLGLSGPVINYGTMESYGWEFNIGHNNSIGKDFRYGINFIFSTADNKVLSLVAGTQDNGTTSDKVGIPYHSFYLTQWDGIFQSASEISSSAKQPYSPKPGDLKFKDVSGPNGKPDGIVDSRDRIVVKGAYPAFTYSFNLNFAYKNWGLTAFFQGVQGVKSYVNGWGTDPFFQSSPPPTYFENAWTEQNHSQTIPALYVYGYPPVNGTPSTYSLQNASYLRLKNLRLAYQIPAGLVNKLRIRNATVYISTDNMLTFTKYKGADPETAVQGGFGTYAQFPQVKTISGGLNINF